MTPPTDDPKHRPTVGAKVSVAAHPTLSGIALPIAAFDAIQEAGLVDEALKGGRSALPATRQDAVARAHRMLDVLASLEIPKPDTFVVARITAKDDMSELWHAAPLYPVQFSDGRMMKAVVDPFLRRAPLGLLDWQGQLGVADVELCPVADMPRAGVDSSMTLNEPHRLDVTTKRGGTGTADDSHGLAKLLRAWLRDPSDATQIERFRHLFGEVAWRSLITAYPKLVQQVELEVKKRTT
ncbi:MAG: hypothetical protein ABI321_09005 [Polyangia bacterium]